MTRAEFDSHLIPYREKQKREEAEKALSLEEDAVDIALRQARLERKKKLLAKYQEVTESELKLAEGFFANGEEVAPNQRTIEHIIARVEGKMKESHDMTSDGKAVPFNIIMSDFKSVSTSAE